MKTKVVAEISIHRIDASWYAWAVYSPVLFSHEHLGHAGSATEAVWKAVDAIRCEDNPPRGKLAVHSLDDRSIAIVPIWAVPQYELMQWLPAAHVLELGAVS